MEKRISFYEFQSVKRVAQACDPLARKRDRVKSQIEKLAEEYKSYDMQIKALEAGVTKVLGLNVESLVKKVMEPDAKGNKVTKYLPTDRVRYDESAKQYIITIDDEEAPIAEAHIQEEETVEETPVEETPAEEQSDNYPFN